MTAETPIARGDTIGWLLAGPPAEDGKFRQGGGGTPLSILTSPTGSERPVDPATLEPVSERTTGRLQNIPPFGTNLAETMWRAKISKIIRGGATPTSCRSLASAPIRFHWTITTPAPLGEHTPTQTANSSHRCFLFFPHTAVKMVSEEKACIEGTAILQRPEKRLYGRLMPGPHDAYSSRISRLLIYGSVSVMLQHR